MAEKNSPAGHLGRELRAARTLAGLTQRDLAGRTPLQQVAISRAERGEMLLSRDQIAEWLDATDATGDARSRALAWAEAAHNETRAWPDLLPEEVAHLQGVAGDREVAARLVRNLQVSWVPGLLQTAEYARLLLPQVDPAGVVDVAASVAARLERQAVLYEPGRRFEFLLAEETLLWSPGPGVMAAQRDRIASLATLASVEVGVLPARREGAPSWHSFIFIEPAADDVAPYVTTELVHGGQRVSAPERVAAYAALWDRLWSAAALGDDAIAMIRGLS